MARKYAFIVILSIMGGATAVIGLLPTYAQAGLFSPILLILIRVLQGSRSGRVWRRETHGVRIWVEVK